ncbi:MAG: H-NS family nucleoid-associated regulatory protein [Paracoccaceae bacterium]
MSTPSKDSIASLNLAISLGDAAALREGMGMTIAMVGNGQGGRMTHLNLGAMSLEELRELQKAVGKAIDSYGDRMRAEARAKLEAMAREMGLSLSDLMGTKKTGRAPSAAKYRHPEDAGRTWSGRGRKPMWFQAFMQRGLSPEDLEIRTKG